MNRITKLCWSFAAGLAVTTVAVFGVGSAAAQDDDRASTRLAVERVDATGEQVVVDGTLVGASVDTLELVVDGSRTDPTSVASLRDAGGRNDVVVVLDNAWSLGNAAVQLSKDALSPLFPESGSTDSLGVVTSGGRVQVPVGPTGSDAAVQTGLDGVAPDGVSATWDAVARAAAMLEDREAGSVGTVVLFTASEHAGAPPSSALSALQRAGVRLDVVALSSEPALAALDRIVDTVGGTLQVVPSDEDLAAAFANVSDGLAGRFRLTFPSVESDELVPLELASGSATTEVAFTPGAIRSGASALAPVATGESSGFATSSLVKWFALLLGVGAAVTLVWTLLSMVLPSETNLESRLEAYDESFGSEIPIEPPIEDTGQATVPIIRRAVELTGEMADRRGMLDKVEVKLERANLPLRAAEAMFFTATAVVLVVMLVAVSTSNLLVALVAGAFAAAVPVALLDFRIRKRRKAFVAQLPDMLTLLAGTLKAGYSIGQGFESVSTEIDDPMGRELRRVVTESRLGRSLEESLESVAERMDSDDFAWAVMAIKIQREVGGNLAELLMTVADTMTQRERLRRDVATLTAEGRISAVIIGLLPPALAAVLWVMNPAYIGELFQPGLGYGLIVGTLVMMGIGFAWMKKTITIEV